MTTLIVAYTKHFRAVINFLTVSNFIFLTLILPKIIGYFISGSDVFLSSNAIRNPNAVQVAALIIFVFIITINVAYIVAKPANRSVTTNNRTSISSSQRKAIKLFNVSIVLPISLAALGLYFIFAGISLDNIIMKRDWSDINGGTIAYVFQKLAQLSKVGFFIVTLGIISDPENSKSWRSQLILFSFLLIAVYSTSSQRSGVILLLLQIVMIYFTIGKLKIRTLLIIGGTFLMINLVILASRFTEGLQGLNFFEMFVRRYFFEIEKISMIFEYSVKDTSYLFYPVSGLLTFSGVPLPTYNVHYYIGSEIFGYSFKYGVPPSILGEIILYVGAIYIVPITLLITISLAKIERVTSRSHKASLRLFTIILLSDSYFLLLNSDIFSLIKKLAFDSALLTVALIFFSLVKLMVSRLPKNVVQYTS